MTTLRVVLDAKPPGLVAVHAGATVLQAVRLMEEQGVGSVLVVDGGELRGIFSERDAVRRVLALGLPAGQTFVGVVMMADFSVVSPETPTGEAVALLVSTGRRHLVVGEAGELLGVVSIGDLAKHAADDFSYQLDVMDVAFAGPSVVRQRSFPPFIAIGDRSSRPRRR